MSLEAAAYRKKIAEYAKTKQPAVESDQAEKSKKEKRTKAREDGARKRPPPTKSLTAGDIECAASKSAKRFKAGDPGDYPEGETIFVPDWGLKVNESVTTDAVSAVKFMRGVVPPEDRDTIRKYDPSHLTGLLAIASSTALFISDEVTARLLEFVEADAAKEKKIKELEESSAAAQTEVANARATLQRIDEENVKYKRQNKKLRDNLAKKEKEWQLKEKEHMDGNLIMYSSAWVELRAKAKERYPEMDLSDIPSDLLLNENVSYPPEAEGSGETRFEVTEAGEGKHAAEGDGDEENVDGEA